MTFNIDRFIDAQNPTMYNVALSELENGSKRSHWMWFIFPQLRGLGRSPTAQFYGLEGAAEARAYLAHPILGERLRTCTQALLRHVNTLSAEDILGTDACKLRSCMTLFQQVASEECLWSHVLGAFFKGQADPLTLKLLATSSCE